MKADLHVHSTASDGACSPSYLVELAHGAGLTHLALTDHDSVEGLQDAFECARDHALQIIPGVELSSVTHDGRDVHVLGYWVDSEDGDLLERLATLREGRLRRAKTMVDALSRGGFDLDLDTVLHLSNGGAVGRSHVARALVASRQASSVRDAFERLIGKGRPFYVPKDALTPDEAVSLIEHAGGIAVIAHPAINALDDVIRDLASRRHLAGVEAYHADHTAEQAAHYTTLADECGLLVTGGSDFHGPDAPNPPLGSVALPAARLSTFLAAEPVRSVTGDQ